MAQRWKTFTPNSTLPAADVNDVLNPSTADHLARAVAAGEATASVVANGNVDVTVSLPSGRFTSAPKIQLTLQGTSAGMVNMSAVIRTVSSTSFQFRVHNTGTTAGGIPVHWLAVQM